MKKKSLNSLEFLTKREEVNNKPVSFTFTNVIQKHIKDERTGENKEIIILILENTLENKYGHFIKKNNLYPLIVENNIVYMTKELFIAHKDDFVIEVDEESGEIILGTYIGSLKLDVASSSGRTWLTDEELGKEIKEMNRLKRQELEKKMFGEL